MCRIALYSLENEILYALKVLNTHLDLLHHKLELIKIQVVVSLVAVDFLDKMIASRMRLSCVLPVVNL